MREPILKHGLTALKAAEAEAKVEVEAKDSVDKPVEDSDSKDEDQSE